MIFEVWKLGNIEYSVFKDSVIRTIEASTIKYVKGFCSDFMTISSNSVAVLLEIPEKYGVEIDIMIEAKLKEQAIFKLYEKYPQLSCKKKYSYKIIEKKTV